ncbi:MAG: glycosyltransferase [Acidobacteria bacterium]|nr:MAG: glycosyltransferase [Acidobacteriota bacterium]
MRDALSLVVCTYKRPAEVDRLLAALAGQRRQPDETLVVDASADDRTAGVVARWRRRGALRRLRHLPAPPEHRGLTRQRNYGIEHAGGDVVAFLDDDTVPEPTYVEEVLACFARHPGAVGVGGYATNEACWRRVAAGQPARLSTFRFAGWERREDRRWRLRRLLGLAPDLPPGFIPPAGHGRPITFLPPDGRDYRVETLVGCAMSFRRSLFERLRFSPVFEGYGLYEDLDFSIRALRHGELYLATRARLEHHHAPGGRPDHLRYGIMVVKNGYLVWRRRWPHPGRRDRLRWWATTLLLAACRPAAPPLLAGLADAAGRLRGMLEVLIAPPAIGEGE